MCNPVYFNINIAIFGSGRKRRSTMMIDINVISLFVLVLVLLIPILYYFLRIPSIPSVPTATPHYPLIGNSVSYGMDPIKFLLVQRARHGDIFLVDLAVIRIVFFLGPEGTNAILKGTDKSGISFWAAMETVIGGAIIQGAESKRQLLTPKVGLLKDGLKTPLELCKNY
jgi:hypothetical protein